MGLNKDFKVKNGATITQDLSVGGNAYLNALTGTNATFTSLTSTSATFVNTVVTSTSALSVINNGTGPALYVRQKGSNQPIAEFVDQEGGVIYFADTGNLGINTTDPNEKLTISGNVSATGNLSALRVAVCNTSYGGFISGGRDLADIFATTAGAGSIDGSGTANYLAKWSDSDTITNSIARESSTQLTVAGKLSATGALSAEHVAACNSSYGGFISGGRDLVDIFTGGCCTGTIDGSGTTCHVPYFSDANTIASSCTYFNSSTLVNRGTISGSNICSHNDICARGDLTTIGNISAGGVLSAKEAIRVPDNAYVALGNSDDLKIKHTGSESQIFNNTGQLDIRTPSRLLVTSSGGDEMIRAEVDGSVCLYYDDSAKLCTTNTGVNITGGLSAGGLSACNTRNGIVSAGRDLADIFVTTSGNVDGSGTANFLPSWSDSDTLTDSLLSGGTNMTRTTGSLSATTNMLVGGNIGVGTCAPNEKLTVSGNISSTGNLSANGNISLTEDQRIYFEADKATWIETDSADRLRFVAGGKQMLLLDQDTGDRAVFGFGTGVGINIGNNSLPNEKLTVAGNISATGTLSAERVAACNSSYGGFISGGRDLADIFATSSGNIDGSGTANFLPVFSDSNTIGDSIAYQTSTQITVAGNVSAYGGLSASRAPIYFACRVGIGTSAPEAPLHVNSTGGTLAQFHRSGTQLVTIGGSSNKGQIRFQYGSDCISTGATTGGDYSIDTGGSVGAGDNMFYVCKGGNVGVGTTAPNEKLTVSGNVSSLGGLSGGTLGQASFLSGNLGIGTNRPTSFLHVSANKCIPKDLVVIKGGGSVGDYDGLKVEAGNGTDLFRVNQLTYNVLMPSSGKVGIGNTAPNSKLTVTGNVSATGTLSANNIYTQILYDYSLPNSYYLDPSSTSRLNVLCLAGYACFSELRASTLTVKGNISACGGLSATEMNSYFGCSVGVGVTTPNAQLHVSNSSSPTFRLSRTGTGQIWQQGIDSSGRFLLQEAASEGGTQYTRLEIDDAGDTCLAHNGGCVGIGTAGPEQKLTVAGNISACGGLSATQMNNYFGCYVGIGTNRPGKPLHVNDDDSVGGICVTGASLLGTFERDIGTSGVCVSILGSNADPQIRYNQGTNCWAAGVDQSADSFVIAEGSEIHTGDYKLEVGTGQTTIHGNISALGSLSAGLGEHFAACNSSYGGFISGGRDLADIFAVSSDNVDGSGTKYKIPQWNDTDTLGDSPLSAVNDGISVAATKKIYLNKTEDTYIDSDSTDRLRVVAGGQQMLVLDYDTGNRAAFGDTKVAIGGGDNALPDQALTVAGNISACGGLSATQMNSYFACNIGIGTNSPGKSLEICSGTGDDGIILCSTGSGGRAVAELQIDNVTNGTADFRLYCATGITTRITTNASNPTYFNAGDVGIGTTTPNQKLTVSGNISALGSLSAGLGEHVAVCNSSYGGFISGGRDLADIFTGGCCTGTIDGSGTTCYVSYFTDSDTIAASPAYFNSSTLVNRGTISGSNICSHNDICARGDLTTIGNISAGGVLSAADAIRVPDNSKITLGNSQDLELYHNGSLSYIRDVGTGGLHIQTNGPAIYLQDTDGNAMAQFTDGGSNFLMYNSAIKLTTKDTGVCVTGTSTTTRGVTAHDGLSARSTRNGFVSAGRDLADIFATSTGNVDGSGTANYIAQWSDTDTLTNSLLSGGTSMVTVNGAFSAQQYCSVGSNTIFGTQALNATSGGQNTAIGLQAMLANTTGYQNVAVGEAALAGNTEGLRNVGVGCGAAYATSTGDENVAIGYEAFKCNTINDCNTAVGSKALFSSSGGVGNAAVGQMSMYNNTGGSDNVAVGRAAMHKNTTGCCNTAVGAYALCVNRTGCWNTAIGNYALRSNDVGDYNIGLGYRTLYSNTSGDYGIAIGRQALDGNTTGDMNIAIGRQAMYVNTTGACNSVLGTYGLNCNTTGSYNQGIGHSALYCNTVGVYNNAMGHCALHGSLSGNHNNAIGFGALHQNYGGSGNEAIGREALRNNRYGSCNQAIGYRAMYSNTTGCYNVGIGCCALATNTTANNNVAVGCGALLANTTGFCNTAIGRSAMVSNTEGCCNVALGTGSLNGNTTSCRNIAVGARALLSNTTGDENVAIGNNSLQANVSASYSVAIGANALCSSRCQGLNTAVGYDSLKVAISASNNTALGFRTLCKTWGGNNTAIGGNALRNTTGGCYNDALGINAMYNNAGGCQNTALGNHSLYSNTAGQSNVAAGHYALKANTTGNFNVGVGLYAGCNNASGDCNVFAGYAAGRYLVNGATCLGAPENSTYIGTCTRGKTDAENNAIVIGFCACSCGSNTVSIGNKNITNTYITGTLSASGNLSAAQGYHVSVTNNSAGGFISGGRDLADIFETCSSSVDGSGTKFKIPQWTDADTIGDSAISAIDTGITIDGRLGIGTTDPARQLNVVGDAEVSTNLVVGTALYTNDWTAGTSGIQYIKNSSGSTSIAIENGGNVGIGTAAPNEKLTVSGNISAKNGLSAGNHCDTGGANYFAGRVGIGTNRPLGTAHIYTADAGAAICTNSSHDDLIIENNGNAGIQISGPTSSYQYLAFGDIASANQGYVRYYHDADRMDLRAGGSDILSLVGSNAGISTTTPNEKLTVSGNISAKNGLSAGNHCDTGGANYFAGKVGIGTNRSGAQLDVKGDGADVFLCSNDYKIARIQPRSTGGDLDKGLLSLFDTSTEAVRIDSASSSWFNGGNVGIGTAAPNEELTVVGDVSASGNGYFACVIAGGYFEQKAANDTLASYPTGTIVVIGCTGDLVQSTRENDRKVFGVTQSSVCQPIVLGAEPVLVTGDIRIGDYITTSDKPGHGRRTHEPIHGAVIAQSMEAGTGDSHLVKAMIRKM